MIRAAAAIALARDLFPNASEVMIQMVASLVQRRVEIDEREAERETNVIHLDTRRKG